MINVLFICNGIIMIVQHIRLVVCHQKEKKKDINFLLVAVCFENMALYYS